MQYTDLIKGVNVYATGNQNRGNDFPSTPYGKTERDYLDTQTSDPLGERVYRFLKKWNRRVAVERNSLEESLQKISSINLPSHIILSDLENIELRKQIKDTFETICSVVKYTGASKALHVFQPRLFIMWDDAIRKGYGCHSNAEGYLNFLWRSKLELQEVVATYSQCSGGQVNDMNILQEIERKLYVDGWKPITKLLDEYNFAKYTKKWI